MLLGASVPVAASAAPPASEAGRDLILGDAAGHGLSALQAALEADHRRAAEFPRRFGSAGPYLEAGLQRARQVIPMITAAVYPYRLFPAVPGGPERQSLGSQLADYAKNEGSDPEQFESFAEASRRILAGGVTAKRTPDATSRWFDSTADAILASVRAAEASRGAPRDKEFAATVTDLRILAQLARFHARRAMAAVHYNLFLRGLRLAELYAATLIERDAVAAWRELVAIAGDRHGINSTVGARNPDLSGHWRAELKKLEWNLKELEEQCCPPDEAIVKEKVWTPVSTGDRAPPAVQHERVTRARPGEPVSIRVRATDASGIRSLRLRYRPVAPSEPYQTLDLQPIGAEGEFVGTVPGNFIVPERDFMYFIEAIDVAGNGTLWPDLAKESPYVIVKVAR